MHEESSNLPGSCLIDVSGIPFDELARVNETTVVAALRDVLDPARQTSDLFAGFQSRI